MRKILLISNHVFHYRVKVYNYFWEQFQNHEYEFIVLAESCDSVDFDIKFNLIIKQFNIFDYISTINRIKPDVVIVFLHLKDSVNFPVSIYCKLKGIPHIFWNKGINIKTPNSILKNQLYCFLHNISDAIILYTPNELTYLKRKNHHKVFYGYNTLSFEDIDCEKVKGLDYVKEKYGIKENAILLFAATIKEDKMLDVLLDYPCKNQNVGVVIAGKGLKNTQLEKIKQLDNYYYLGKIPYDDYEMNALYKSSKYFTSPGDIGLAAIQAFFWGKPILVLDTHHSVEVFYLEHEKNSYFAKDMGSFWEELDKWEKDKSLYEEVARNARNTYLNKANVSNMFSQFWAAADYVIKKMK